MRANATGRVLHYPGGGSFRFDAGAVCLDFAHTGGEGPYAVFETLHEPADLGQAIWDAAGLAAGGLRAPSRVAAAP